MENTYTVLMPISLIFFFFSDLKMSLFFRKWITGKLKSNTRGYIGGELDVVIQSIQLRIWQYKYLKSIS